MSEEKIFASNVSNVEVDYDQTVEVKASEPVDESSLYAMDAKALTRYFMTRFEEAHGYNYRPDWIKETAIMKSFKLRYGPDAGLIIKSLFDDFSGKWNEQIVSMSVFSKGSKWIQDQLYFKVQQNSRQIRKVATKQGEMLDSGDFLERFQSQLGN